MDTLVLTMHEVHFPKNMSVAPVALSPRNVVALALCQDLAPFIITSIMPNEEIL